MPLPTVVKTWQFDVNKTMAAQGTSDADHKKLILAIKNSLISFATNRWTVVSSSNAVTASAADNWGTDPANIVFGTTNRSWIVLQQSQINAGYQLCIDMNASFGTRALSLLWSPSAGFTGGSISARPTASDSITLLSQANWAGGSSSSQQYQLHVMMSADGQCTRIATYAQSVLQMLWLFDKANNPVSGWTNPGLCMALAGNGSASPATYSSLVNSASLNGRVSGPMTLFMTTEAYGTTSIGQKNSGAPNDLDGNAPILPIGVASETALMRGRHGTMFDLWLGSSAYGEGDTYPNDSSRQLVHFGNLIHPWNGSVIQIA